MNRGRLKLVHKRKPQVDDLSFMPAYAEQGKYLVLADTFLAQNGNGKPQHDNLVSIEPRLKPKKKKSILKPTG